MPKVWWIACLPLCQTKVLTRPCLPQLQALPRKVPGLPPPGMWLVSLREGLTDQLILTLLVRRRHVKSNKGQFNIITLPTLFQNLPNPHIRKYSAKGSTRNFKTRHYYSGPVCLCWSANTWIAGLVLVHTAQLPSLNLLLLEQNVNWNYKWNALTQQSCVLIKNAYMSHF